jgi:hypothetical protein
LFGGVQDHYSIGAIGHLLKVPSKLEVSRLLPPGESTAEYTAASCARKENTASPPSALQTSINTTPLQKLKKL